MSNKSSKNLKSFKTAAIFFSIGGFMFLISSVVSGEDEAFLPIGIAFVVISIAFWQRSKRLKDS